MSRRALALAVLLAAAACTRKAAPVSAPTPAAPEETYDARLGHDLYVHYCATCHGDTGTGDGFNAYNLDPRPRDLSDPAFQKKSDADLIDAIRRGGAGVGLSSLMPPWAHTLSERQIGEIVLYIRGLKKTGA